jgi:tRNA U34 5-methylaminomethyl-2-thiouridine-forming methyltransferase MnmC
MSLKLIQTNDGSHSLLNEEMNETYHSIHGALQEAQHVFIKHGFRAIPNKTKCIFEMGFGTGLNVTLAILEAIKHDDPLEIWSIETLPLPWDIITSINYSKLIEDPLADEIYDEIHLAKWNELVEIRPNIKMHKIEADVLKWPHPPILFDCIFFDAFAPNKQQEVWSTDVLQKMYDILKEGGRLTTYCAQGQFKRNLKSCGFDVQAVEGPPGKKEMTLGIKQYMQ